VFRRSEPLFFAFDLLALDGEDVRARPTIERKRLVRRVIPRSPTRLRFVEHVRRRGVDLFAEVCRLDVEGIVAKKAAASCGEDGTWLKIKNTGYSQMRDRWERFGRPSL